ncbi:MAG: cation transporter [Clostridia bacterium]|nr:cation transporter [Clostridia bacterium]
MTERLLKLFVKDYKNTEDTQVRAKMGALSGWVGIFCNLILFAGKIIAGFLSGSVSVTADALNNLSDASSSLISLLGFKLSSKPADEEHPYGHARFEYLSGLMVSILIILIGIELLKSCIDKILNPSETTFSILSISILIASVLIKLWMMFFAKNIGRRIKSKTLIAAATDSRNDILTTLAVILGAVLSLSFKINLDGYIGLGVALFIMYSGIVLVKDTLDPLLGRAPEEELVNRIQDRILSYEGVLGTHDLLVHDYGPGRVFASVHVEMAAEEDVLKSHDTIDRIERDFFEEDGLNIIVHFDPIVTKDDAVNDIRKWLSGMVKEIHPALSIHDLRIVPGPTHTNLIFDCVVPNQVEISHGEIKDRIKAMVKEKDASYFCVITIDLSYCSIPK